MDIREYKLDEEQEESGVNAISLVDEPAIELDWVVLNKENKVELKVIDKERRILMGAILVPNKPILRLDENGEEYYIYFTKETMVKVMERFMKKGLQGQATLQHESKVDGVYLSEVWIKEDEVHDKSVLHGIEAPVGSIMGSMRIENDEILALAKQGKINGFSIEGLFTDKVEASKEEVLVEEIKELVKQI